MIALWVGLEVLFFVVVWDLGKDGWLGGMGEGLDIGIGGWREICVKVWMDEDMDSCTERWMGG